MKMNKKVLKKLQEEIGEYDESLLQHCRNVQGLVDSLMKSLGFHSDILSDAALVHDIGKVFINKTIISKPSALNASERRIIDFHSYFGYIYLKNLGVDSQIAEIVLFHHGLEKNWLPLITFPTAYILYLAEILQVCDMYDALTSDRCYHKALSSEDAISILKKSSVSFGLVDSLSELFENP